MDQKKIGLFLKELRKEKNLTQEALAEQLNITGRTVSRWETGITLPDLSVLIEIAELYDVDIKELIKGERNSITVEPKEKEALQVVAKYAAEEKARMAKRIRKISVLGLIGILVFFALNFEVITIPNEFIYDALYGISFGLVLASIIATVLYTHKVGWMKENKEEDLA